MGSSKKFCPIVTKLCAVTKLGDLTVYFEQAPIFYECADILGKRQYFNDFAVCSA
jgi:hypothetical protein